jgi:hypothetical protein
METPELEVGFWEKYLQATEQKIRDLLRSGRKRIVVASDIEEDFSTTNNKRSRVTTAVPACSKWDVKPNGSKC